MIRGTTRSGAAEIAYTVEGDGPETVLLITGLSWRAADWGTALPARLAGRFRVVRLDNRGTGGSSLAGGGFTLDDMATDAVAVLDAVGAQTAHVVGISMGGMITQLLALNHPERVERIVLIATHYGGGGLEPPTPAAMKLFDPAEFFARGRDPVAMMRYQLDVISSPGFAGRCPEAIDMMIENVVAQPTSSNAFIAQLQAIFGSDRSERVREISKPTLVIHGADDTLIPPGNGARLAERIPRARFELLERCGHVVPFEQPEIVATLILDFFDRR